tara:strand:- start:62 stop:313 length:252 start_codon:yes stop_codon:yes gene_type:complete
MSNIQSNVTVHTGTFTKLNGQKRTMRFVKYEDVPSSIKGKSIRAMSSGFETVYDIDSKGFRTFNNATVIGEVTRNTESVTFSR